MNNCVFQALKDVHEAACKCRASQIAYFRDRTNSRLVLARHMESRLDSLIKQADYALLHGCSMSVQSEFPF